MANTLAVIEQVDLINCTLLGGLVSHSVFIGNNPLLYIVELHFVYLFYPMS